MLVVGKGIACVSITNQRCYRALSAGHIPHVARHPLGDDAFAQWQTGGIAFQTLISAVHHMEQRVGTRSAVKQPTIVAHPLGTPQGRRLHVVGSLDDGDAQTRELCDRGVALIGTDDDGIGMQSDDLLHIGRHRVSTIRDLTSLCPPLYVGDEDILQVAHADDAVLQMEIFQQLTMCCREHNHTSQWLQGAVDLSLTVALDQHPLLQDLALLPRIHHGDGSPVALIIHL